MVGGRTWSGGGGRDRGFRVSEEWATCPRLYRIIGLCRWIRKRHALWADQSGKGPSSAGESKSWQEQQVPPSHRGWCTMNRRQGLWESSLFSDPVTIVGIILTFKNCTFPPSLRFPAWKQYAYHNLCWFQHITKTSLLFCVVSRVSKVCFTLSVNPCFLLKI